MTNNILAVVTARGGSSLSGKNYRLINGKPLFIWSLIAALKVDYINYIAVSSNCPKVEEIFYDFAANDKLFQDNYNRLIFINRPEEISGPQSKNEEALIHAVDFMEEYFNFVPDSIVNLQPTSPVRNNDLLSNCIEEYYGLGYDSLVTVNRVTPLMWQKTEDGLKCYFDIYNRPMRQSILPEKWFWHDAGNVYLTNKNILMSTGCRVGNNPCLYEISDYQALQIDSEFHFDIVEQMSTKYGQFVQ